MFIRNDVTKEGTITACEKVNGQKDEKIDELHLRISIEVYSRFWGIRYPSWHFRSELHWTDI